MKKREVLLRCVVFVLCAAVLPGGVRAAAMSDEEFVELCREGAADQVKRALADGANPNARDGDGATALMSAASGANLPVMRALLDAGADVNAKHASLDNFTALQFMTMDEGDCKTGVSPAHARAAGLLLEAGAEVFGGCPAGASECDTPLRLEATGSGDEATLRVLLEHGAGKRPGELDRALFSLVERGGAPGAAAALLEAGANANAKGEGGVTALMRAAEGHEDAAMTRMLLEAGADKSLKDDEGCDALCRARRRDMTTHPRTMERLLGCGWDIDDRGDGDDPGEQEGSAEAAAAKKKAEASEAAAKAEIIRLLEGGAKR